MNPAEARYFKEGRAWLLKEYNGALNNKCRELNCDSQGRRKHQLQQIVYGRCGGQNIALCLLDCDIWIQFSYLNVYFHRWSRGSVFITVKFTVIIMIITVIITVLITVFSFRDLSRWSCDHRCPSTALVYCFGIGFFFTTSIYRGLIMRVLFLR